jgi:hypothetical protein
MLEDQYTWVRSAFDDACDPIWTVARSERMQLLKSACLAAAEDAIRPEMEELGDDVWGGVLDTLETEIAIIVQGLAAK